MVCGLFDGQEILYNSRKISGLEKIPNGGDVENGNKRKIGKSYFELDVWMPLLKLGFEVQVFYFISFEKIEILVLIFLFFLIFKKKLKFSS